MERSGACVSLESRKKARTELEAGSGSCEHAGEAVAVGEAG